MVKLSKIFGLLGPGLAAILLILVVLERPVYGYTDPGSGALIWQALMAAVVGLSFYFRRILSWFRRYRNTSSVSDDK
jgi:hypothetical protein